MDLFNDQKRTPDVILLDYQATLVANFHERQRWRAMNEGQPYHEWIKQEVYREWLVDLIKNYYVILITARTPWYIDITMKRIKEQLNWQPQEHYFNRYNQSPPACKREIMNDAVFPKHGTPKERAYLALESNKQTRAMYKKLGIEAIRIQDPITELPKVY